MRTSNRFALIFLLGSAGLGATACAPSDSPANRVQAATHRDTGPKPVTPPTETPNELPTEPLPPPPEPPPLPAYHLDGELHINETQFKGTHNSYHVRPSVYTSPAWDYDMPSLTNQANRYGVRAFEIDVHWDGRRFPVYHWPDDPDSSCAYVTDCVAELRRWSKAHPRHAPIFVFFDLKHDDIGDAIANHLDDLEAALAANWPREKVFTPDDLTGGSADVSATIRNYGWPTLEKLRGKVVFALMTYDDVARRYAYEDTHLRGRLMHIASGDTGMRHTSIAVYDEAAVYGQYIRQAALGGYLVRARADDIPTMGDGFPERFQAVLAAGANIVVTDYPVPFYVPGYDTTIPGGTPVRCNPVTARSECASLEIENPANMAAP